MKKLLFLFCLLSYFETFAQGAFTAPIGYNTGVPTAAPSTNGTRWRYDLLTNRTYKWSYVANAWQLDPEGIDVVSGSIPPVYTPGLGQSKFAINGIDSLYRYAGGAWHHINKGGATYTAGQGIAINGSNVISTQGVYPGNTGTGGQFLVKFGNTAGQAQYEALNGDVTGTQGNLRVGGIRGRIVSTTPPTDGQVLQFFSSSNSYVPTTLPAATSDGLGTGFVNGGGNGTIPDGTDAIIGPDDKGRMRFGKILTIPDGVEENHSGAFSVFGTDGFNYSTFQSIPDEAKFQFGVFNDDGEASFLDLGINAITLSPAHFLTINYANTTPAFNLNNNNGTVYLGSEDGQKSFELGNDYMAFNSPIGVLRMDEAGLNYTDNGSPAYGMQYADEYPTIAGSRTSIPYVGLVRDSFNGIYSKSGIVPNGVIATITDTFAFKTPTVSGYAGYKYGNRRTAGDFINFYGAYKDANHYLGTGYDDGFNGEFGMVGNFEIPDVMFSQFKVTERQFAFINTNSAEGKDVAFLGTDGDLFITASNNSGFEINPRFTGFESKFLKKLDTGGDNPNFLGFYQDDNNHFGSVQVNAFDGEFGVEGVFGNSDDKTTLLSMSYNGYSFGNRGAGGSTNFGAGNGILTFNSGNLGDASSLSLTGSDIQFYTVSSDGVSGGVGFFTPTANKLFNGDATNETYIQTKPGSIEANSANLLTGAAADFQLSSDASFLRGSNGAATKSAEIRIADGQMKQTFDHLSYPVTLSGTDDIVDLFDGFPFAGLNATDGTASAQIGFYDEDGTPALSIAAANGGGASRMKLSGGGVSFTSPTTEFTVSTEISLNVPVVATTSKKIILNGRVSVVPITSTQKATLTSLSAGDTIFCSNCTATDGSTGVMQTYNGTTWKNNW